ncbi:hypothetical protein KL918_000775 [Ogataea parapolymorpha]|nr:hypothetical protein KL918_000775 [Ogataea parapolymorpha]KAG7875718.1 hypothetical protein KL916_000389 [Ogataea parapolymorpha]
MVLKRSFSTRLRSKFAKLKKSTDDPSNPLNDPLDLCPRVTSFATKLKSDQSSPSRIQPPSDSQRSSVSKEVVLLPYDPEDQNSLPCSTEQLTPIMPRSSSELLLFPLQSSPIKTSGQRPVNQNMGSFNSTNTPTVSMLSPTIDLFDSAISKTETNYSLPITEPPPSPHINNDKSIFAKANQIDHFDKTLDMTENDKLAEQMALNILDKISEEQVDELALLKDEVIRPPRHSTFTAINHVEDEKDIEEHSRELQIELGFKLFEEALSAQKQGNYDEANAKYQELFRMEVLTTRNSTNNPAIETLKYLCLRNRGVLKLAQIKRGLDGDDHSNNLELFNDAVDDLTSALCHGKGDLKLIELLIQIFERLKIKKLSRFAYEYELLKTEHTAQTQPRAGTAFTEEDDIQYNLKHLGQLLPSQLSLLRSYKEYLQEMGVESASSRLLVGIENRATPRKEIAMDAFPTAEQFKNFNQEEPEWHSVTLACRDNSVALEELLKKLNELLPKKGRSKIYDSYILTDRPIEGVNFELVETGENQEESEPRAEDEAEENDVTVVPDNEDSGSPSRVNLSAAEDSQQEKEGIKDTHQKGAVSTTPTVTKRQTRANKEAEVNELSNEAFVSQFLFLEQTLPQYLLYCGVVVDGSGKLTEAFLPNAQSKSGLQEYYDLAHIFDKWNKEDTETLFVKLEDGHSNEESKEASVKEILSSLSKDTLEERRSFQELDDGGLKTVISSITGTRLQFNQIRLSILNYLFSVRELGGTLVTDGFTSVESLKQLRLFTDAVGLYVYRQLSNSLLENGPTDIGGLSFGVSVLEILVDYFISLKVDQKLKKFGTKALYNEIVQTEQITSRRIERWIAILNDYFENMDLDTVCSQLWLRTKWCQMCYLQHLSSFDSEVLSTILTTMANISKSVRFDILMVNFPNIPRLNRSNIEVQLSKMKIFKTFTESDASNEILERILVDDDEKKSRYNEEEKEMDDFISRSPFELKMRLWTMLFKFYREAELTDKFLRGFERVLQIMLMEIEGANFAEKTFFQRKQLLLKILGFFDLFAKDLVNIGVQKRWDLQLSSTKNVLLILAKFSTLSYIFLLHEDSAQLSNTRISMRAKSRMAYKKLADIAVVSFTLLSLYYSCSLIDRKPEYLNDFYAILHEQLGLRHICNGYNSVFLDFVEKRLVDLDWEQSDNDFFQTLKCHYGINISTDSFSTFDHGAEPGTMEKVNAITVNKYMMKYCYKRKHPIFNVPKADIKNILDMIYDVLGDPEPDNYSVSNNMEALTEYLETRSLDTRLMRLSFYGLLSIPLDEPIAENETNDLADGVYFMQGLLALTLFKIRKRTMQGRSAELDFVIKMFEYDIASGSYRFESWLLLAQAYSYLVEDDIIWTSDKLNNVDKKRNTAILQRKSLLCYFMSISLFTRLSTERQKELTPVATMLWTSLGKELYNAMMSPMERLALEVDSDAEPTCIENSSTLSPTLHLPLNVTVYKVLEICFRQACNLNPKDWYSHFYLAKSQSKLRGKNRYKTVAKSLLTACDLALKASDRDDHIVEPHYFLCSLTYKSVMRGDVSLEEGLSVLKSDLLFQEFSCEASNLDEFGKKIIGLLQKCISYDRKNWQHRPKYRIAKIYIDQYNDLEAAKNEMLSIINLKSTVRNLSNIWKPENERPGKHFVYNHNYIVFFVELLDRSKDVHSLFQLIKKLRKLGSSMIDQIKVFDLAVAKTCAIIKEIVHVVPGFLDEVLSKLVFADFVAKSKEFVQMMKEKETFTGEEKLILYFLFEVGEFRRMANGFAATGVIDECFHTLFLILFTRYEDCATKNLVPEYEKSSQVEFVGSKNKPGQPSTPSREKVKVARRDITPFCIQTISAVGKLLDSIKRENGEGNLLKYTIDDKNKNPEIKTVISTSNDDGSEQTPKTPTMNCQELKLEPAIEFSIKRASDDEESSQQTKKQKHDETSAINIVP